jgi:hypothetical protein
MDPVGSVSLLRSTRTALDPFMRSLDQTFTYASDRMIRLYRNIDSRELARERQRA